MTEEKQQQESKQNRPVKKGEEIGLNDGLGGPEIIQVGDLNAEFGMGDESFGLSMTTPTLGLSTRRATEFHRLDPGMDSPTHLGDGSQNLIVSQPLEENFDLGLEDLPEVPTTASLNVSYTADFSKELPSLLGCFRTKEFLLAINWKNDLEVPKLPVRKRTGGAFGNEEGFEPEVEEPDPMSVKAMRNALRPSQKEE